MSEHGFYHPSIGYWQAIDDVPRDILEAYPDGTIAYPLNPGDGSVPDGQGAWAKPPARLDGIRTARIGAILETAEGLLGAGAPVSSGLHLALDDGSRADLTAMAATAVAVASGTVPWPETYARGWITVENVRIPLATPADGLTLATAAGTYYAAIVQHRRDLKDAALAAPDEAALAAIDIATGWPTS